MQYKIKLKDIVRGCLMWGRKRETRVRKVRDATRAADEKRHISLGHDEETNGRTNLRS